MSTHLNVAVIGELDPSFEPHVATNAALAHSAARLGVDAHVRWHATDDVGDLAGVDALLCSPGSPYRSLSGALEALRHGRERGVPTLGTCGGFQHMVLEYARNVLGFEDAAHAEYDPDASLLFLRADRRRAGGVTLGVLEGSDAEVLEWLQTGAVDVATLTSDAPGVATTPLARDRFLAIVPAAHRLAERPAISLADLAEHPFIMPAGGCEPLIAALAQRAGVELRCHYRVRDTGAIAAMVADGLGVTIMPELCLPAVNGAIRALDLEPAEERSILLGLPADSAPLPAARAFVEVATAGP